jgi:hypothetical protein
MGGAVVKHTLSTPTLALPLKRGGNILPFELCGFINCFNM